MGEVLAVRRERCVSMTRYEQDPGPAPGPCGRKPVSSLGWGLSTTWIERSPLGTIPSLPPRLRLRLAATPAPHGLGASRLTVGIMSAGSVRVVPCPHICVGYC